MRERIKEVFEENNGIFGAGKITAILREEGIPLTKEMTLSLMQEMGLKSLRQSSKKLYRKENSVNWYFIMTEEVTTVLTRFAIIYNRLK